MIAAEDLLLIGKGFAIVNEREVQEAVDRAVRNEARILTIESTVKAVQEISSDVRKDVRNAIDELRKHTASDDQRFASIDSRFMGEQAQLTSIMTTLANIEKKMTVENEDLDRLVAEVFDEEGGSRLRPLLTAAQQRREFWAALRAQWAFVLTGAGGATTIIGLIIAARELL